MKLNQVIGSLITEITKAQANSDAYAKEIKEYYEEDAYLKLLTTAKITVKEVNLDLKYAILETEELYKWILGTESNLPFDSIDIGSEDSGQNLTGLVQTISLNGLAGAVEIAPLTAENSDGNNYEVKIGDQDDTWVIGDRLNQRVVALNLKRSQNGNLEGTVTYNGENPIEITCVKAEESEGNNLYIINYNNILSTDNEVEVEVLTENLNNYPESMLSSISITLDMDNP